VNTIIVLFLKFLKMVFGALFRSSTKKRYYSSNRSPQNLSDIDRVKYLERRRQQKGYKEKWLYYRCKEEHLLTAYYELFPNRQSIKQVNENTSDGSHLRFTFGKYQGETIDAIWEKDRQYIEWLSNQDWLSEYYIESEYIKSMTDPNYYED